MDYINISDKWRGWIYVSIVFIMPTMTYLSETGRIGTAEMALVTAYVMAAAALARVNITPSGK